MAQRPAIPESAVASVSSTAAMGVSVPGDVITAGGSGVTYLLCCRLCKSQGWRLRMLPKKNLPLRSNWSGAGLTSGRQQRILAAGLATNGSLELLS